MKEFFFEHSDHRKGSVLTFVSSLWPPPPFPSWKTIGIVGAISALVTVPCFLIGGVGAVMAASGGFTFGAVAVSSVGVREALPRVALGAAVVLVFGAYGGLAALIFGTLLLSGLASAEFAKFGTRSLVAAIFSLLAFEVGLAREPDAAILIASVIATVAGMLAAWASGISNVIPRSPGSREQGLMMFLFLAIGLALSFGFAWLLNEPRSYWIAYIFVFRGLLPLEGQKDAVKRYGLLASIGVIIAVCIELLPLPGWLQLVAALAFAMAGLRYIAHPVPIAAMAFTVTILLVASTNIADAVYRLEAVAIVVMLVVFLSLVLDRLWIVVGDKPDR